MSTYDDLFDDVAPTESVFADKGALDSLEEFDEIAAREEQEEDLARILSGVHEGFIAIENIDYKTGVLNHKFRLQARIPRP